MFRGSLVAAIVVLIASLAIAGDASASDATVKAAGDSQDAKFEVISRRARKAFARWEKANYSRRTSLPLLRAHKAADRLEDVVTRAVKAEQPSTAIGAKAKHFLLLSNANFSRYMKAREQAIRLGTRGKTAAANRRFKRGQTYATRSSRQAKAARRLFKQVL